MSGRPLLLGGVAIAGVAGYYLYSAGGDTKVAKKDFEHDAATASNKIKSQLPGSGKEAKTEAKLLGEQAGQKFDQAVAQAKDTTHKVDAKLESYRASAGQKLGDVGRETGSKINSAIDSFDKNVEQGAAKSKSWVSGWFGGK